MGRLGPLELKQLSPPSSGPVRVTLKGLSQSLARAQAKAVNPAGLQAESPFEQEQIPDPKTGHDSGGRDPTTTKAAGKTDRKNVLYGMIWVNPVVPECSSSDPIDGTTKTEQEAASDANIMATKKAAGQGAASAQAVQRGHPTVTIIEVPDEEDDTVYRIWLDKSRRTENPPNKGVVTPEPMKSRVPPKDEALSNTAARATLFLWVHKDQTKEITKELLDLMRKGGEVTCETLYELREPICYVWGNQSEGCDLTLSIQLEPCTGTKTLMAQGLLDSGCTGSSINRSYIQKHALNTRKTAVPIPVYNADRTHNKAGDVTKFVKLRLTIGDHSKCIDLAVTDLGSKDLYLGHDWLKRHNPIVNWRMGSIIFGRC
ncbi:uncharacterized protein ARMOST_21919 [Armillaria ostoyae]|uniref:Peptidase A2 domain-containing protein n=1 Tax=Armillaria ostoyae TaxID=47428 RepID=A0A284SBD6_ARMOS|nr:uncharacterized protein ARMOST_21919 [Armillaria ostoyae]